MSSAQDGPAFAWEDAYRVSLADHAGANRALRLALADLRGHFLYRHIAVGAAFTRASELDAAGWWWQARTLRIHATRAVRDVGSRAPEGRALPPRSGGTLAHSEA